MEENDRNFESLVESFSKLAQVEAIALGGSRARGQDDASSDYDLYIYLYENVEPEIRKTLLDPYCSYMEINNQFWETEDDCTLNNGIDIDIIYRNLDEIAGQVFQVINGLAYNGYTTCMWDNLLNAKILFDRDGKLTELQESLNIPYPETLRNNIIKKNLRLLTGNLPSYDKQIRKAMERKDLPSISHRTTAFLESYFDILFAINRMLHPGEKRMMERLAQAEYLPEDFSENLTALFESQYTDNDRFLSTLQTMIEKIQNLAAETGVLL